jgi:phytoene synthase
MLIPILAQKEYEKDSQPLKDVAIELGKAMQITNILRDVREDLTAMRVYFPQEVLDKQNINLETLRTGIVTPEYRSMIEQYITLAEEKYSVFYTNAHLFDEDARLQTVVAAKFYEGILQEIRRADYNNLTKRHYVSTLRKRHLFKQAQKELKLKGLWA